MNKLLAIVGPTPGAGHGECFIWKRRSGAKVVAVDAGGAASVGKHAGQYSPEILILSHDDSDHIRGAVELISTAGASLQQLWIPAEWAILIKQIADTNQDDLLPEDIDILNLDSLEVRITEQITNAAEDGEENRLTVGLLALAEENLSSWSPASFGPTQGFSIVDPSREEIEHWYGANSLGEIIKRVKFRAITLIGILTAALNNSVQVRFFSIDLALSSKSKNWENEGMPGTATLANASEAPHSLTVRIPPGLTYAYALTRLTVQNRRALCTLLWTDRRTPNGGIAVWSDTDGNWLDHSSPLGLGQVISTLRASSAPHHASANPEHNRVWEELRRAPDTLIMISAGGQKNQTYRPEYDALNSRRCCTWCRPKSTTFQQVSASSTTTGSMILNNACIGSH